MDAVYIFNLRAVLRIDVYYAVHQLSLQFNGLVGVKILRYGHSSAKANRLMLVCINFWLDILNDSLLLLHVVREHFKVFSLLDLNHLDKSLAHLPVFFPNVLVLIQSGYVTALFLKHHVHFADAIDRVGLLPHGFQVSFFLQTWHRMSRHHTVCFIFLSKPFSHSLEELWWNILFKSQSWRVVRSLKFVFE